MISTEQHLWTSTSIHERKRSSDRNLDQYPERVVKLPCCWSVGHSIIVCLGIVNVAEMRGKNRPRTSTRCQTPKTPGISRVSSLIQIVLNSSRPRLSRELAPAEIRHVLILVLARPHDLSLPQRQNVSDGGDEPHDNEQDGQSAADAIDARTVEGGADLDGSESKTGIREDELKAMLVIVQVFSSEGR